MQMSVDTQVSFDDEALILVDEADNTVGHSPKQDCHEGGGRLHRAFSIFVFNERGELLLQQRSAQKMLWPLYWSNSCCSHPRQGENMASAVHRRLAQELSMTAELEYLYKFIYRSAFEDVGTEHELCHVWAGRGKEAGEITVNSNEIAGWRWIDPQALDTELAQRGDTFTPWMKMEWQRLRSDFRHVLEN